VSTEVLYRKWRPRTFAEVAGQDAIVRTLLNAITSGRVSHAYLFAGPRGTGKTTTGRLLAKAVNCLKPKKGEPCNRCDSCQAFLENRALDLVELDAASNRGIDEIRSLREKANFAPTSGAYKVYLVDEVHMLTEPAFNALLKTLEEPPPHIIFVLATTEIHKVPATILSRCQRFDFRRIPLPAIVDCLERIAKGERITCPREGLELMARTATGSLRDAINMLEQVVDYCGRALSLEDVRGGLGLLGDPRSGELAAHALSGELAQGLGLIASVRDDGVDLRQFQRDVIAYLRGLLLVKTGAGGDSWTEEQLREMQSLVDPVPTERLVTTLRAFGEADLRADPLSPLPLELALATCALGPPERRPKAPEAALTESAQVPPAPPPRARPAAAPRRRPQAVRADSAAEPAPRPGRIASLAAQETQDTAEPETAQVSPEPSPAAEAATEPAEVATEPVGVAESGDPALEQVRARWHEIYAQARALNHRTGALLNSGCDIIEVSDEEVVFGFRFDVHVDKVNTSDNLAALQEAVDEVLGTGRRVRCVAAPDLKEWRAPQGRGGHLIQAAREMGARVISEQE
jgi:DNA polymerase-3 subunit gamma/tau